MTNKELNGILESVRVTVAETPHKSLDARLDGQFIVFHNSVEKLSTTSKREALKKYKEL